VIREPSRTSRRSVFAALLLAAVACRDSATAPTLDSHAILFQIQNALYSINPDGTGEHQITDGTHFDGYGAWSANGSRIAFTSNRGGRAALYTMRADGSDALQVTTPAGFGGPYMLSWSSKDVLAYSWVTDPSQEGNLVTIPAGGGTPFTLQTDQVIATADWAPDGNRIAFVSTRDGGNSHIFVINADGTGLTEVSKMAGSAEGAPSWSADGRHIAFMRAFGGGDGIWFADPDGANPVQVTTMRGDAYPSWSPDGSRIAFTSTRDGPGDLYIVNADGSHVQRLTTTGVYRAGTKWRRVP
jgi:Tol biopolymer transport system component